MITALLQNDFVGVQSDFDSVQNDFPMGVLRNDGVYSHFLRLLIHYAIDSEHLQYDLKDKSLEITCSKST